VFHFALPRPAFAVRRSALALAVTGLGAGLLAAGPAQAASSFPAGSGIARSTGETTAVACTDGFNGRASDGHPVLITAGHCGAKGAVWVSEKDWRTIGRTTTRVFRTDSSENDWAIVRSNGNYALGPTVIDAGRVRSVERLGKPAVGMAVCSTGRTSGTRCGHITRVKADGIIVTDLVSDHGDSGSPLYRRIPGSTRVAALGILTYGDEKSYTAFQRLSEILRKTGVHLRQV
jgi:hypothetical protein